MEASLMFVDCPAYLDNSGSVRGGLPDRGRGPDTRCGQPAGPWKGEKHYSHPCRTGATQQPVRRSERPY
jgi:hypothetical protein